MSDGAPAALKESPIFSRLTSSDQARLAGLLQTRTFHPDEAIFFKGDEGLGLYIICEGRIKICVNDWEGHELVFSHLTKGDVLGEISLLDGFPRSATAIAVEECTTCYLDRQEFLEFLRTSPQASLGIILGLCKTLRRVSTHLEEVSFLGVAGRLARILVSASAADTTTTVSTSQEQLADLVGASRVIVNRVLKSFADLGYVSLARKKIAILDRPQLEKIGDYDSNAGRETDVR